MNLALIANRIRDAVGRGLRLKPSGPHFMRDYHDLIPRLVAQHGYEKAMEIGVGGEFQAFGRIERALLVHLGLRPGHFVMDVGCGSGRLAAALADFPDLRYHGTDIVEQLLGHARKCSPPHFRFTRVDGLKIPEADGVADFVTFFSVATHLMHHETYTYLTEATRVLKPGGRIVVSFFELLNPRHWATFTATVDAAARDELPHLNAFIEQSVIRLWAAKLGLTVVGIYPGGTAFIPIDETIVFNSGMQREKKTGFGQSVAVLRKG